MIRFPLRARILLAFSLFYLMILAATGYSAMRLGAIERDHRAVNDGYLPLARVAAQLLSHQERMDLDLRDAGSGTSSTHSSLHSSLVFHNVAFVTATANGRRIGEKMLREADQAEERQALDSLFEHLDRLAELQRAYEGAAREWLKTLESVGLEDPLAVQARELLDERQAELQAALRLFAFFVDGRLRLAGGELAVAQAEIRALGSFFAGGTLLVGLLLLGWTLFTLRPITRLTEEAQRVARGDYSGRIEIEGQDEIGTLAREFNAMALALAERDRRLQERASELNRLSVYLRKVLDTIDQALLVVEGGQISMMNPAASRMWSIRLGQQVPEELRALKAGHHPGLALESRRIDVEVVPFGDDGRLLLVEDVTEHLASQEQAAHTERLALIGKMLAQVCHEVRNPLNALSLNTEMLAEELSASENAEAHELLGIIGDEIRRLEAVTERYLELARRPGLELRTGDLSELLRSVCRSEEPVFRQAGILLEAEIPPAPCWADFDEEQVRRAIRNILRNALQSGARGVRLELSVQRGEVELRVSDDGHGMDASSLERAFDPFFTTTPRGTGLGLPMTRQIVEMHGGRVSIRSAPDRGCTVSIVLPVAIA